MKKWAERGIIILPKTNSSHLKHLGLEDEFPFEEGLLLGANC